MIEAHGTAPNPQSLPPLLGTFNTLDEAIAYFHEEPKTVLIGPFKRRTYSDGRPFGRQVRAQVKRYINSSRTRMDIVATLSEVPD